MFVCFCLCVVVFCVLRLFVCSTSHFSWENDIADCMWSEVLSVLLNISTALSVLTRLLTAVHCCSASSGAGWNKIIKNNCFLSFKKVNKVV